mgnify:CR=1 FL=1
MTALRDRSNLTKKSGFPTGSIYPNPLVLGVRPISWALDHDQDLRETKI